MFVKRFLYIFLFILLFTSLSCSEYRKVDLAKAKFMDRIVVKTDGGLSVGVAALGGGESLKIFGADLAKHNIQPVWVEITNNNDLPYWLFPIHTDSNYYSPAEVAYTNRSVFTPKKNSELRAIFEKLELPYFVAPKSKIAGFIYTNMDPGLKFVKVSLVGSKGMKTFQALVEVPGIKADYQEAMLKEIYSPDEFIDCNEARLREELKKLPSSTTNKDGTREGDPLNLIFVGDIKELLTALIGSGWDVTERLSLESSWRTVRSFLFRKYYRHAPVSPLYVFGRRQDAAFQKPRQTIDERNHLRVWLTPLRYNGKSVWVGQISRDIGIKLTLKTGFLVTHVIDSDVDNDRYYLIQGLADSKFLARLGYVQSTTGSTIEDPRYNLGGDPYFSDGLRAVMVCSDKPIDFSVKNLFDWKFPPDIMPHLKNLFKQK